MDSETLSLDNYVPKNASLVISFSKPSSFLDNTKNNQLTSQLLGNALPEDLDSKLKTLDSLNFTEQSVICLFKDAPNYLVISKLKSDSIALDTTKFGGTLYSRISKDKLLLLASDSKTLTNAVNSSKEKRKTLFKTPQQYDDNIHVYSNSSKGLLKTFFINKGIKQVSDIDSLSLSADLSQNTVILNGILKPKDSSLSLTSMFRGTVAQEVRMPHIAPSNTDGFLSITFDEASKLLNNLNKPVDSLNNGELFDFIAEIGILYEGDNRAVILRSIDINATNESIQNEQNLIETYRQTNIYSFTSPNLFNNAFSPLIEFNQASMFCILDEFLVFGETLEVLQNIIASYQNKTTIGQRGYYETLSSNSYSEASLTTFVNAERLEENIKEGFINSSDISIKNSTHAILQLVAEQGFAHCNVIVNNSKVRRSEKGISEQFNITLDSEIIGSPMFVTNHRTKEKDVLVQDINNTIYLISNKGKIFWKKTLESPIIGKINQIDMYKNGRLQLAFVTDNKLHVLDRNGKEVSPFPLSFRDKITQPLSVFDYDKNRNYRLLVTQGREVLMYDAKGKIVKGFTFKKGDSEFLVPPKHFRVGNKDYLVLKTQNSLYILNRTGQARVNPKKSFNYSTEAVYWHDNKFTTTNAKGDLITIDRNGNTAQSNISLDKDHSIDATSRTLVSLFENKLTIRDKTLDLDLGSYSNPKITIVNNKLYVSITDLQTQKVYLFDSQAKLQPNFPLYGNSKIDLADADKDNALEFVVKGDSNNVILYQIN